MKEVKLSELKKMVQEGKKKVEIAEYYGLSVLGTGKLLKQCGLKIRKFKKPAFKIIDDTVSSNITIIQKTI